MRRFSLSLLRLSLSLSLALAPMTMGCELYDAPPKPVILGAEDGILDDPNLPLELVFSEPIDPKTLSVKIMRFETDVEGNLPGDSDPNADYEKLFEFAPDFPTQGGEAEFVENNTKLVIAPSAPLPIGPKLVLIVEPGLADLAGHVTKVRKRLLFAYNFKLDCNKPSKQFPTGKYFLLADIKQPLKTQVQLWASFIVDPATGVVRGQCTNADRIDDPSRCSFPCKSSEVCRTLPMPACVPPSERAGTEDEYPDYTTNPTPPFGYSFTIDGCAQDQPDDSVVFVTAPTDVIVQQPPVTLRNVTLTAQFKRDMDGVLRGTGSLASDQVIIGTTPSGKGEGGLVGRLAPDDEAPPGIPEPPPKDP